MLSYPRHQPGDYIVDRYLVQQILPGGMGDVYHCLDIALNEHVAVKTFQERYVSAYNLDNLLKSEARAWIMLERHPNIVQAKSAFILDQRPYITLEWITGDEKNGNDLRARLRQGPLESSLAIDFAIQLCYGLAYAYRKLKLVHRDVKPENLLITRDGILKLTDFGLAHLPGDDIEHSRHYRFAGTPQYMSPEHWLRAEPSVQADIYSVGCIIFEMITGKFLFKSRNVEYLRNAHMNDTPPDLRLFTSEAPEALAAVVSRCLEKNPLKRFLFYDDIIDQLKQIYKSFTMNKYERSEAVDKVVDIASEAQILNNGNTLVIIGKYLDALYYFERLLKLNPNSAVPWLRKAECLCKLDRRHEALIYFRKAEELEPSSLEVAASMTRCLIDIGRREEARECCDRVLTTYPNNKDLLLLKRELMESLSISIPQGPLTQSQTPDRIQSSLYLERLMRDSALSIWELLESDDQQADALEPNSGNSEDTI